MKRRHEAIINLIKEKDYLSVDELAEFSQVSAQTIRKDLSALETQNLLTRVHGGAVLPSKIENLQYNARSSIAKDEKNAIAKVVAKIVEDGSSLFINIGTTTEACAKALFNHKNLMVVTNNINVASHMRLHETHEVLIAGGVVRHTDGGIIGASAVEFIKQFRVDYAIIGVSAIYSDGALMDFDLREVKVAQAIMENARHVILVADSSKFSRQAPVRISHINQVNSFVTDQCMSNSVRKICFDEKIKLIETNSLV